MKMRAVWIFIQTALVMVSVNGQSDPFQRISFAIGEWEGTGEGFGNSKSAVVSRFEPVMNGNYIEVTNESIFESTQENPKGDHHIDRGFISYEKERGVLVYRQFNNEGYINQYILNDTMSSDSALVFETESIENFLTGGKARMTIRKISDESIQTVFDVSFPNRAYACFGTNHLKKKQKNHL